MLRRIRGPIIGLLAVLGIGIASLRSSYVLAFVHHYANFVAVGRSTVKIFVLAAYAVALFLSALLPPFLTAERARRWLVSSLYIALGISMASTLGMVALIAKLNVPLATTFYAVNAKEFSFGHLTHSHLLRPVGYLLKNIFHVEVGTAWFDVLRYFLHIPAPLLIASYIAVGIFAIWLVFVSLAFAQHRNGMALKLLCLVAGVAVIKSLIDGAFLDASALLGVVTLGMLTRDRFLIFLPIPFLVIDFFVWFTPTYLPQIEITIMLLAALWLLHVAERHSGSMRTWSAIGGIAFLCAFGWYGAHISFFAADDAVAGIPPQKPLIPANQAVYFLKKGDHVRSVARTTYEESPAAFVAEHDVQYESLGVSLRLPGKNCRPGSSSSLLNQTQLFAPSGKITQELSGPLLHASSSQDFYSIKFDSCTPDILPSLSYALKDFFPEDPVIVIAFTR